MKRKNFIKAIIAVCIVVVAVCGVYHSQKSKPMSDLMLANVEALADGEGTMYDCYLGGCYASPWYNCWTYEMGFPKYSCPNAYGGI